MPLEQGINMKPKRRRANSVISAIPKMSNDDLFGLFENAAAAIDTPEDCQAKLVRNAIGAEWKRRPNLRCENAEPAVSLMTKFGYRVGNVNAVPAQKRRKILKAIFTQSHLPPSYRAWWGRTESSQRYFEIRNRLFANIDNAERTDPKRYARAIREWSEDLKWLDAEIGPSARISA